MSGCVAFEKIVAQENIHFLAGRGFSNSDDKLIVFERRDKDLVFHDFLKSNFIYLLYYT